MGCRARPAASWSRAIVVGVTAQGAASPPTARPSPCSAQCTVHPTMATGRFRGADRTPAARGEPRYRYARARLREVRCPGFGCCQGRAALKDRSRRRNGCENTAGDRAQEAANLTDGDKRELELAIGARQNPPKFFPDDPRQGAKLRRVSPLETSIGKGITDPLWSVLSGFARGTDNHLRGPRLARR